MSLKSNKRRDEENNKNKIRSRCGQLVALKAAVEKQEQKEEVGEVFRRPGDAALHLLHSSLFQSGGGSTVSAS